jgi:hypothetical protein
MKIKGFYPLPISYLFGIADGKLNFDEVCTRKTKRECNHCGYKDGCRPILIEISRPKKEDK